LVHPSLFISPARDQAAGGRNEPAAGSSGACDGLVFLQSKPGLHLKFALESRKRFDTLIDILDAGLN
jgi:hypothetical protein